jgi:hypothetical protein
LDDEWTTIGKKQKVIFVSKLEIVLSKDRTYPNEFLLIQDHYLNSNITTLALGPDLKNEQQKLVDQEYSLYNKTRDKIFRKIEEMQMPNFRLLDLQGYYWWEAKIAVEEAYRKALDYYTNNPSLKTSSKTWNVLTVIAHYGKHSKNTNKQSRLKIKLYKYLCYNKYQFRYNKLDGIYFILVETR